MSRRGVLPLLLASGLALATVACGSDDTATTATSAAPSTTSTAPTTTEADAPSTTVAPQPPSAAAPDLPAIDVVQLSTGDEVALQSLVEPGRPTLLWFWAPHCTFCRREAPEVLAFIADHADEVDVLGVGAQDNLDQAHGFLDDTDTHDVTMVWDASGQSWVHHGVTSQPTVIVLDADGQVAGRWYREFDPDGILAAAGVA
jgi:thiol-disulfide isomerase/thioredoxin